jgi:hypothetical protein
MTPTVPKWAGNGGCGGQRHDDFQDAAPERLARIEAPKDDVAHREHHSHQREREKHKRPPFFRMYRF